MSSLKDKKSIHYTLNTLSLLLDCLVNEYTVIDLRNETAVRGKIASVDGYMNVDMEDCIFKNARGEMYPFKNFFVTSRNIRYVHVPKGLSAMELMQQRLGGAKKPEKKKRTFKLKRAAVYQQEILKELAEAEKECNQ